MKNSTIRTFFIGFALFALTSSHSFAYPTTKVSTWSDEDVTEVQPPASRGITRDSVKMTRSSNETPVAPRTSATSNRSQALSPLSPGSHNLSIGIGQIFLTGNFSKNYDNAIGTQVQYTYGVSDLFSFESNFGYSSHSQGDLSMVNLVTGLRTNLIYFDQLVPFFSGGLGFYKPSLSFDNNTSATALLFGLNLGVGADLLLSDRMYFGTRMTFHDMFGSNKLASNGTPVDIGGSFVSFIVHAGFSF